MMEQACHVGPWEFQRFVQGDRPSQGYQGILSSGLRKRQNCFPALGLGTLEPDDCSVGWKELLLLRLVFRSRQSWVTPQIKSQGVSNRGW